VKREVTMMAQRLVAKLLHEPTVRLKAQAANGNGMAYAHLLTELIDLDCGTGNPGSEIAGSEIVLNHDGLARSEHVT
jgi:hypothetical protein